MRANSPANPSTHRRNPNYTIPRRLTGTRPSFQASSPGQTRSDVTYPYSSPNLIAEVRNRPRVGNVAADADSPAAVRSSAVARAASSEDEYVSVARQEFLGRRTTNAATCAGDKRRFPGKRVMHARCSTPAFRASAEQRDRVPSARRPHSRAQRCARDAADSALRACHRPFETPAATR
jgi:hypothetical protein